MKALQWLLVVVGVVGVLIFSAIAVGPVWLNTFIHTAAFRHEMEKQASQSLGGTVEVGSIDFSLWRGVTLHGLVTKIDSSRAGGQGALAASVESVSCSYSLPSLLDRRLELTGVTLRKPVIILTRQPAEEVMAPSPPVTGTPTPTTPGGHAPPFGFLLDGAKIEDGALSIRDATGASLAELHGIGLAADTAGFTEGKDVTGTMKVADIALPPNVHVTDFSTPFTYRPGAAEVKPFEAEAFNGRLAGNYELGPTGPSLLELNGKGIDLAQVTQAVQFSPTMKLAGALDLQSKWRGVESGALNGEGDAQISGGQLSGVPMLHDLAGVLRMKELDAPEFRSVQTHFEIANGQTRFTGLQVQADLFQLTGDGVVGAGGSLNANMVLILTPDAMSRIPKEAALFFVQRQDGSASVAFHIGGTTSHPQTDLTSRIFLQGAPVQNVLNNALNSFFHKKKHNPPPAAPAQTPADTPAAPPTATPNPAPVPDATGLFPSGTTPGP